MPDLDRIDAMPMEALAGTQQIIDRRSRITRAGCRTTLLRALRLITLSLAVVAAFRMRFKRQLFDNLFRRQCHNPPFSGHIFQPSMLG